MEFTQERAGVRRQRERGFSLLEMVVVVSISLIISAIAILNVQTTVRVVRLQESGIDYSNLLQKARIRSVQDDTYYAVVTTLTNANPTCPAPDYCAFMVDTTGNYVAGSPMMAFGAGVKPVATAGGPALINLQSKFLPPSPPNLPSLNLLNPPTFSARGLPCTPNAGTCSALGDPTSYITFMQNTENGKWLAVTVTPAGRIQRWSYDGVGNWSALN
jgi:prepilin-type N-terminal cleavage/methylation domain-containing protein